MTERSRAEEIIEALTARAVQFDEENKRTPPERRPRASIDISALQAALVRAAIVGIEMVDLGGDGVIHAPNSVTIELVYGVRQIESTPAIEESDKYLSVGYQPGRVTIPDPRSGEDLEV